MIEEFPFYLLLRLRCCKQKISYANNNGGYRECLRNHAASLGSYATDGCGEFTTDENASGAGLTCAACGCHRNFHRKVSTTRSGHTHAAAVEIIDYGGGSGQQMAYSPPESSSKKRFRTKFTEEQKKKMLSFAEELGCRPQRKDLKEEIERFCQCIGISRKVFKVWMHNHKNSPSLSTSIGNSSSLTHH